MKRCHYRDMIHFEWSKLSFCGSDDRVSGIVTSAKGGPGYNSKYYLLPCVYECCAKLSIFVGLHLCSGVKLNVK